MKKILLRITLFFFSFFVISFFLYCMFLPLYSANSIIITFAITPFDIAKSYPKIWEFLKKTYFIFMFISYSIVFNYLYNTFQKYFEIRKNNKSMINSNSEIIDNDSLKLIIGKDSRTVKLYL